MTKTIANTTQVALKNLTDKNVGYSVPLLGKQLWWSITKIKIDINEFRKMWIDSGLDPALAPKEIRGRSCVLRTLKALEIDGFVREIACDKEKSVFVLVDEEIDKTAETARYDIDQNLVYDKKSKTLKAGRADFQPIIDNWMADFKNKLISLDIRGAILDAVKASGSLTLADKGGFYFIPADKLDIIDQLELLVGKLGGTCSVDALAIADLTAFGETGNGAQLIKNFRKELIKDLESKLADLEKMEANPVGKITCRRFEALSERIVELDADIEKVFLYEDLLKIGAEDLHDKAAAIKAKAREMMRAL